MARNYRLALSKGELLLFGDREQNNITIAHATARPRRTRIEVGLPDEEEVYHVLYSRGSRGRLVVCGCGRFVVITFLFSFQHCWVFLFDFISIYRTCFYIALRLSLRSLYLDRRSQFISVLSGCSFYATVSKKRISQDLGKRPAKKSRTIVRAGLPVTSMSL